MQLMFSFKCEGKMCLHLRNENAWFGTFVLLLREYRQDGEDEQESSGTLTLFTIFSTEFDSRPTFYWKTLNGALLRQVERERKDHHAYTTHHSNKNI
jgi:hypothetical protein